MTPEQFDAIRRPIVRNVVQAFGIDPADVLDEGLDVSDKGGITRVAITTKNTWTFVDDDWTVEQRAAVEAYVGLWPQ